MKVLVLGCGMQGRAVIFDLLKSDMITEIVGADMVEPPLDPSIYSHLDKFSFVTIDANDRIDLRKKMNYLISLNSIKKIFLFWGSDALDKLWLTVVWVLKPIFMFAILLSIKQPLKVKTAVK